MEILNDPFFWTTIGMFGFVGGSAVVSGNKLGKRPIFGIIVVGLTYIGRVGSVICEQPRFEGEFWHLIIGGVIFITSLIFSFSCGFLLKNFGFTAAEKSIKLRTTGLYGITRNPIYFFEVLWFLGLSLLMKSTLGIVFTFIWWLTFLIHTLNEEQTLERELGNEYLEYMKKVRGRIIPGLDI